jgi:cobalt-zinc-cadmium efflux system outer membrane protein
LVRARREPIPNVSTQVIVEHQSTSGDTVAGVTVGIPLPIWNKNQGAILQSEAEVLRARRNAQRVELNLKSRLALAFQRYSAAQERARIYSIEILPKAEENFKLVQSAFPAQVGSVQYLTAQRTYFQTKLAYIDALAELWVSWSEIQGMLLSDSLSTIPGETER